MTKKLLTFSLLALTNIYAQDGTLDTSFGTNGKVVTTVNGVVEKAKGVALQSDGKIVVAGYTYSEISGNDFVCIRYNTNGSLDTSFGNNGKVTVDLQLGSDDKANGLDIEANTGKIILGGYSDDGTNKQGALVKLNTDGSLDTTFGTQGKVLTDFTPSANATIRQDEFRVIKIHQLTGNIIAGGTSFLATNDSKPIMARYTSNGSLDTTFNTTGKITSLPNTIDGWTFLFSIEDLAVKSNGKITAVGYIKPTTGALYYYSDNYTCRINANGTLDTTFDQDGYDSFLYATSDNVASSIVLNPDDSFYFGGQHAWNDNMNRLHIGLTTASGVNSYNTIQFWQNMQPKCFALAKDTNGRLVMGGSLTDFSTGGSTFMLLRLTSAIDVDTTFGTGGYTATSFENNTANDGYAMKIQTDGKIILAGASGNKIALARYHGMGTTGTDEQKPAESIKLYPNPANSFITITSANNNLRSGFVIYDINGREITSGTLQDSNTTVNVASFAKGVYFIKLTESGTTLKFIKN